MTADWVVAIASVVTVLLAIHPLRWGFRLLIGIHEFLVEWPKVRSALTELQPLLDDIRAETKPNGGSSMRDAIHRIDEAVAAVKDEQARLREQVERHLPKEGH